MASKTARRDAGSGALYYDAGRDLWTASVTLPPRADGKRRRKVVRARTKAAAAAKLRALRGELDRAGDLATSSPTVETWARRWLSHQKSEMKPTSWVTYERTIARYILPVLGRKRLDKLTTEDVRRLRDYIVEDRGLSATTAATAHGVLTSMLKAAVVEGVTPRNVAALVKRPRRAAGTRKALSAAQARTLLGSVVGDPQAFVRWSLALIMGMRQGECLGLTRDEVDLDAGTLTIAWQLQSLRWEHGCGDRRGDGWPCGYVRGAWCSRRRVTIPQHHESVHLVDSIHLLRPKSDRGWRTVPMPAPMLEAMKRYLEQTEPGLGGVVLHRGDGRPIPDYVDAPAWHAALRAAGLPSVPLHSARHTTSSLLHELGVSENIRMAILGHATAQTNRGYTHVSEREVLDAMARLGALMLEGSAS